ncbi:MAG TPA: type I polyketide synthase, partial [Vicinamibacterales bacterium]|nr:type I polyketide synthase [Vicinamibacterales bacterium]
MSRFAEEISKLSKQRLALLCVELQRELHAARQSRPEPIAIIGLGCRLPGGVNGPEEFWHLLENGIDAIGPIPSDRWNVDEVYDPVRTAPGKIYTRSGGFVDRVDEFDPEFFGISPREARHMDPQHRLLLEVAWEALEHAGQPIDQLAGSPSGVFIGIGTYDYATWQTAYLTHESVNAYTGTGNAFCFAAGRLSYLLGLHGPSLALDAACATSLVAVHLACQSLRAGECTLALAGGVNLMLTPEPTIFLSKAQALSPDGRCKTFDASADGYGRGEGCGIVVLKRLSDAIAAGDPVLAVIRGSAVNHDGRSAGLTVPNGTAQQAVIREALAQAGVSPRDISYVEAHGTGTALGDPIEIRALSAVLGRNRDADNPLWIGAVKTNIGHLEVAAGVANLMKVALALQHRTIPPHLHYRQPNPHIAFDEIPARIPVTAVPWTNGRGPRLAGVSSFGLSGTNAHVVVEEFRPTVEEHATADDHGGPHVLTLSARDEWSLRALASACEQSLAPGGMLREMPLSDICYTASARRSHHRYRWAAVVDSIEEARRKLAAFASQESTEGSPRVPARREHKLAFVFAGQGSQWWAMGRDLMAKGPAFLHAIEECDEIFRRHGHISILEELRRDEATSRISDTEIAQPALFAVQVALVRLLASWGVHPDSVIGHSAGEVAAAHAAGVLTLEDAARLALLRGRVM